MGVLFVEIQFFILGTQGMLLSFLASFIVKSMKNDVCVVMHVLKLVDSID